MPERPPAAAAALRLSASQLAGARSMVVDGTTAEVVRALSAAGVRSLLLKGPVFAALLFDADEVRRYGDTDLLVAPGSAREAARVLAELGFSTLPTAAIATKHATLWTRDGEQVDLHHALWGPSAPAQAVWEAMVRGARTVRVGGAEVEAYGPAAALLHVALHAAQHARTELKVIDDLERALARAGAERWEAALALAREVGAAGAFAAGLARVPAGAALAARLGLGDPPPLDMLLRSEPRPGTIRYLHRLSETPGVRGKLALIPGALFPPREFVRRTPLARRGRLGLALAYLLRLLRGLARVPGSALQLAALRRRAQ